MAVTEGDPFKGLERQIEEASTYIELDEQVKDRLKSPERFLEFTITAEMDDGRYENFSAYRSQFNNSRGRIETIEGLEEEAKGPYKGGIRYHEDVNPSEVKALSGWMVYKTALANVPMGGGKGGICLDPGEYSETELRRITEAYIEELSDFIGPEKDVPAPDVNTGPREMRWMREAYEDIVGGEQKAVVTGKDPSDDGSEGRVEATGRSVAITVEEMFGYLEKDIEGSQVAVQGFGNVGSIAAELLADAGASIVAVSDSKGGIYDSGGLDVSDVQDTKAEEGTVTKYEAEEEITNEELLTLDVDLLVPAAMGDVIDESVAPDVEADIIAEGANGPITYEAELALEEVDIVPDVLANAGGVTVSYFEWIQNLAGESWTEMEVNERLEDKLVDAFDDVVAVYEREELDSFRTAAYINAVEKVAAAYEKERG